MADLPLTNQDKSEEAKNLQDSQKTSQEISINPPNGRPPTETQRPAEAQPTKQPPIKPPTPPSAPPADESQSEASTPPSETSSPQEKPGEHLPSEATPDKVSPPQPKKKAPKIVLAVLALLFILASVPAAVYLVKQRQEIRKEATNGCPCSGSCNRFGCTENCSEAWANSAYCRGHQDSCTAGHDSYLGKGLNPKGSIKYEEFIEMGQNGGSDTISPWCTTVQADTNVNEVAGCEDKGECIVVYIGDHGEWCVDDHGNCPRTPSCGGFVGCPEVDGVQPSSCDRNGDGTIDAYDLDWDCGPDLPPDCTAMSIEHSIVQGDKVGISVEVSGSVSEVDFHYAPYSTDGLDYCDSGVWQLIEKDTNGSDGWNAEWNTSDVVIPPPTDAMDFYVVANVLDDKGLWCTGNPAGTCDAADAICPACRQQVTVTTQTLTPTPTSTPPPPDETLPPPQLEPSCSSIRISQEVIEGSCSTDADCLPDGYCSGGTTCKKHIEIDPSTLSIDDWGYIDVYGDPGSQGMFTKARARFYFRPEGLPWQTLAASHWCRQPGYIPDTFYCESTLIFLENYTIPFRFPGIDRTTTTEVKIEVELYHTDGNWY